MLLDKYTIKEKYLDVIKNEWLASSPYFPEFLLEISEATKTQNEQYIQTISDNFQKQLKRFSRLPLGKKRWKQKTLSMLNDVLYQESIIGIHQFMDNDAIDSFQEELKDFLRQARRFAPELSFEEIGQALRNYIVYAMFKEIHQVKSEFSMPGFGYSMLYPFTDNYIDNSNYTAKEKLEYNQIIRDKIEGKEVHPTSEHQHKTCELLEAIESEYPRNRDSTIYTLLLMMLDAQEDSLKQQHKLNGQSNSPNSKHALPLTAEERLDISLYKGGISVLIDRFFVQKELTEEEITFYLGLGFFLQLADDLQDIKSDSHQNYQTIFTIDLHPGQEEKIVNKMLHFIHRIMNNYQAENDTFKSFILSNCNQLIFSSIIGSKEFFTKEYLAKIEKYLPITYPFLEDLKINQLENKEISIQENYMKLLDELLF